jgi:tRNA A22 N-methylase
MQKIIAICGLICNNCPASIATQKNDYEELTRIAELWSIDDEKLTSEDITCYGCLDEEKTQTKFCSICNVRRCGLEMNVKNCAYCKNYPCEKLEKLWEHIQSPEAKETLERISKLKNLTDAG